jgi:hypothetical protein
MKPRQEKPKTVKPRTEEKPKRFRIVKLEERIAPSFSWGEVGSPDLQRR